MRTLKLILLSLTLFLSQGGYSSLQPYQPPIQTWVLPIYDPAPQGEKAEIPLFDIIGKEKYPILFEDKVFVLMVLGNIEYWNMNCGTLSKTGEYYMNLAVKKHGIDIDEMNMDMSFQTGLFAAILYNDCDIFLGQVNSIGLGMMFKKNPHPVQEIIFDRVPYISIQQ